MHRRSVLVALALGALAVLGAFYSVPLAGATQPKCLVVNVRSGQSYGTLQEAVTAASAEDTLKVKGTCYGTTTISKNLTIVGQSNPGFGPATLNGAKSGSVVTVEERATVAIMGLTITGGSGTLEVHECPGRCGGGVLNDGSLTLTNSTVSDNEATVQEGSGGGIYNNGEAEGVLTLISSTVTGNTATLDGGGIRSINGALTLINSAIAANKGNQDGGGISISFTQPFLVTINNSSVTGNTARIDGGGIEVFESSATLNNSTVSGNSAPSGGGLIDIGSSVTLHNTSVKGNTATGLPHSFPLVFGNGGGIFDTGHSFNGSLVAPGTLALDGSSSVSQNTATRDGGGIYSAKPDAVSLNDSSSVTQNTASSEGGGIYSEKSKGATLTFGMGWMGSVTGNEPDDIFFD
jgi:predicted outer membrane repeat protein